MAKEEDSLNGLEKAMQEFAAAGDDLDGHARSTVLAQLAKSNVTVLLSEPPTETGMLAPSSKPMIVSDGPDRNQPMLAIFSRREQALEFRQDHGRTDTPMAVPGIWAVLATPAGAGIVINPNHSLSFRIPPQAVDVLREDVRQGIGKVSKPDTSEPH